MSQAMAICSCSVRYSSVAEHPICMSRPCSQWVWDGGVHHLPRHRHDCHQGIAACNPCVTPQAVSALCRLAAFWVLARLRGHNVRLQPGGAGITFCIGEARCNICYGQVYRMFTCCCVATLESAMLLISCMFLVLSCCWRSTAGYCVLPAVCGI